MKSDRAKLIQALPIQALPIQALPIQALPIQAPPIQALPIHVLFVEDEFLISEWVTQALSEQGFRVQAVATAAEALKALRSSPVDVLFTDINLPGGMDGAALARRAREMRPHLPVVYASARSQMLDPAERVPGSTFVPKPYEPLVVGRLLATVALKLADAAAVPA